ncbi:MAG: thiol-disulfide oxidoreductase DCC family protein [Ferruginibacter sp.]
MADSPIVLFDGVCNFCNSAVNFVIRKDKNRRIKFAALQSATGQQLLKQYKLPLVLFTSFVFIEKGSLFTRSTAALKLCKYLTGGWPLLYGFIIVPAIIRNGIYNIISRNRYNWFGKRNQCMVPTPQTRDRFLQ